MRPNYKSVSADLRAQLSSLGFTESHWAFMWERHKIGSVRIYGVPISALDGIPPNPVQCNTEANAVLWGKQRSPAFERTHTAIVIGVLPDGSIFMIDGHTRLWLWRNGLLDLPPMSCIDLDVFAVSDRTELEHLYAQFDNENAAKNIKDNLQGAFRKFGFVPQSSLMSAGSFSAALREAYTYQIDPTATKRDSIIPMFGEYEDEIRLLDTVGGTTKKFIAPFFVAALLTTRHWGSDVVEKVWKPYQHDEGNKIGKRTDAIYRMADLRKQVTGKNPQGFRKLAIRKVTALAEQHMSKLIKGDDLTFQSMQDVTIERMFEKYQAQVPDPASAVIFS